MVQARRRSGAGGGTAGDRGSDLQADHAVVVAMSPVHHARHGPVDVDEQVEVVPGIRIVGGSLGADHGTTGTARDLDPVADRGQPRVAFLRYLHLEADDLAIQLLELAQLLDDVLSEPLGDFGVTTLHDNVHSNLLLDAPSPGAGA